MQKEKIILAIVLLSLLVTGCTPKMFEYSVSGKVTDKNGIGIPDVTLAFSDGFGVAVTDADGNWEKNMLKGEVKITPTKEDLIFTPADKIVSKKQIVTFIGNRDESSEIEIYISLKPKSDYTLDAPKYYVLGSIKRLETYYNAEFNDAVITVNGVELKQKGNGYGYNYYFDNYVNLHTGDSVHVKISHFSFKTVEQTLIVPPSINSLNTDPADLNKWVTGEVSNVTLSWDKQNCDEYKCWISLYDESQKDMGKTGHVATQLSLTLDQQWLYNWENKRGSFATLQVYGNNKIFLQNFYGRSLIEISSPTSPMVSTLPGK